MHKDFLHFTLSHFFNKSITVIASALVNITAFGIQNVHLSPEYMFTAHDNFLTLNGFYA